MKKLFLLAALCAAVITGGAQKDLSGVYGYTMPLEKKQPPKDKTAIPGGQLVLIRMEDNKYRFWLDVLTGPPGYNRGETDGTIIFVNDTASFDNTFENAENPCILKFKLTGNIISINSQSTSFNCGFGNGVNADGDYPRLKSQPVLDNKWLRTEYPGTPMAMPADNKTEIFQDENCFVPFSPKKYFIKGDSFLSIAETEKSIYTEYFPAAGKFIWGWLKKSDIQIIPPR
ncbi:MAG: hypothetical protein ACT4OJ_08940 [Bacteroidota bacterium]